MIIGNGLLANAFRIYENDDNILIFASGVSNSKETKQSEFDREFGLLCSFKNSNKKLVYFSTTSINDKSLSKTDYIKHKIKIENYIKKNFKNYLIFRLPNVIGKTENKHTSFNFFKEKIFNGEEIEIQKSAIRYFIDIDDISITLPYMIPIYNNLTINVAFENKSSILSIINIIEDIMNKKANYKIIEGGFDYTINNKLFLKIVDSIGHKVEKNYNYITIQKYIN